MPNIPQAAQTIHKEGRISLTTFKFHGVSGGVIQTKTKSSIRSIDGEGIMSKTEEGPEGVDQEKGARTGTVTRRRNQNPLRRNRVLCKSILPKLKTRTIGTFMVLLSNNKPHKIQLKMRSQGAQGSLEPFMVHESPNKSTI